MRHGGSGSGYTQGCRCELCKMAYARRQRVRRKRRGEELRAGLVNPQHGTRSTYLNYECRCPECTAANKVACREYAKRRAVAK